MPKEPSKAELIAAARLANQDFSQDFWNEVRERMLIREKSAGEKAPVEPLREPGK